MRHDFLLISQSKRLKKFSQRRLRVKHVVNQQSAHKFRLIENFDGAKSQMN